MQSDIDVKCRDTFLILNNLTCAQYTFRPFFYERSDIPILIYNPQQNIWDKIEKFSKTGQDKKTLIFTFACFFTAITKV